MRDCPERNDPNHIVQLKNGLRILQKFLFPDYGLHMWLRFGEKTSSLVAQMLTHMFPGQKTEILADFNSFLKSSGFKRFSIEQELKGNKKGQLTKKGQISKEQATFIFENTLDVRSVRPIQQPPILSHALKPCAVRVEET